MTTNGKQPRRQDPLFFESRARAGGLARARKYSREWRELLSEFCHDRRWGKTRIKTFKAWLAAKGLTVTVMGPK